MVLICIWFALPFLPTLVISCLLDNTHSNRWEVIAHCGFDLHFPDDYWCWASFYVPVGHLYIFFGKMAVQVLCLLLNQIICFLLLSCITSLHILDINPFSDIWFANIFSHSMGCLFIVLIIYFTMQKLFFFGCSPTCLFLLFFLCFWCHVQKIIAKINVMELSLCFLVGVN